MDSGAATLLAGLFSGVIAGSIGTISAILTYRMARGQSERQVLENDKNRRHQLRQLAMPRRLDASQVVWRLLFKIEQERKLSPQDLDAFIAAQMWLPQDLRTDCLGVLQALHDPRPDVPADGIAKCRAGLVSLTGLADFNEWSDDHGQGR